MMNGISMATALKSEATGALKGAVTAVITYQFDPTGFAQYDGGKLLDGLRASEIGEAVNVPDEEFGTDGGFGGDGF
jgi:hypothetical protein